MPKTSYNIIEPRTWNLNTDLFVQINSFSLIYWIGHFWNIMIGHIIKARWLMTTPIVSNYISWYSRVSSKGWWRLFKLYISYNSIFLNLHINRFCFHPSKKQSSLQIWKANPDTNKVGSLGWNDHKIWHQGPCLNQKLCDFHIDSNSKMKEEDG